MSEHSDEFKEAVIYIVQQHGEMAYSNFDHRIVGTLFEDWGIDPVDLGVEVE